MTETLDEMFRESSETKEHTGNANTHLSRHVVIPLVELGIVLGLLGSPNTDVKLLPENRVTQ